MKRYILFANNNIFKHFRYWDLIQTLINPQDIIVTFNHCLPKNYLFPLLHKDQKIYHFSRQSFNREVPYSGLHIIDQIQDRFDKLYLWPHPDTLKNRENGKKTLEYLKEKTSLDISKISHMTGNHNHQLNKQARQFLRERYNNVTNMSTGMIAYVYINQIKQPEDQIILIGFSHSMNTDKHNYLGEIEYFRIQEEENKCIMIPLK